MQMKYAPIFFWLCILSFVCLCPSTAQNPVQITNYNYKNYKGGIQNWGITISPEQVLYAGNNNGLLKYNGNDWTLLEPGERGTVRAVHYIGNRIYTAGDNNIGYWEYAPNGRIVYTNWESKEKLSGVSAKRRIRSISILSAISSVMMATAWTIW